MKCWALIACYVLLYYISFMSSMFNMEYGELVSDSIRAAWIIIPLVKVLILNNNINNMWNQNSAVLNFAWAW